MGISLSCPALLGARLELLREQAFLHVALAVERVDGVDGELLEFDVLLDGGDEGRHLVGRAAHAAGPRHPDRRGTTTPPREAEQTGSPSVDGCEGRRGCKEKRLITDVDLAPKWSEVLLPRADDAIDAA